ncbi:MAG: hypothetical protein ACOCWA_08080 [Bacteroidota bacterium]
MKTKIYIVILIHLVGLNDSSAQDNPLSAGFSGQLIGWTNLNFGNEFTSQSGLRYIPELTSEYLINKSWKLDAEASANIYGVGTYAEDQWGSDRKIKPYRLWLRLSSDRFIVRGGLQKINFGSASLLRPLMWFDQIDPRDPLQLTDGVYGLLARYYFLNNANIWFWVLYGNDERRGWDVFPSDPERPELGGRFQFPLGPGELALSYHHRKMNYGQINLPQNGANIYYPPFEQERIAIDGKWDVGVGLWFENSLKMNREKIIPGQKWTNKIILGIDYTFGVGNGLNSTFEHLIWSASDQFFNQTENINYSALSANYPVGLLDRLSTIIFYNWNDQDFYRIINWNRQYDNLTLYLMAYWNPDSFNIYQNNDVGNLFSGKGMQFMITINH